jgi:hypothetical protein
MARNQMQNERHQRQRYDSHPILSNLIQRLKLLVFSSLYRKAQGF